MITWVLVLVVEHPRAVLTLAVVPRCVQQPVRRGNLTLEGFVDHWRRCSRQRLHLRGNERITDEQPEVEDLHLCNAGKSDRSANRDSIVGIKTLDAQPEDKDLRLSSGQKSSSYTHHHG